MKLGISQSCTALCCAVLELGYPVPLEICKLLDALYKHTPLAGEISIVCS